MTTDFRIAPARPSQPLFDAAQVRAFEQAQMASSGLTVADLMTRAGAAAFTCLRQNWPTARRISLLAGRGNNGGDACVLAALAQQAGFELRLAVLDPHFSSAEAQAAFDRCVAAGVPVVSLAAALDAADWPVWVDGLFGFGLDRPLQGELAECVARLNLLRRPVLALDLPSGLSADRGVIGPCVQASVTLSFLGLKAGSVTGAARQACGALWQADLLAGGVPHPATGRIWQDQAHLGAPLPPRPRHSHKGQNGHVLVIGGAAGMAGAARLCAEAALRCGAGWVSACCHETAALALNVAVPEVMARGFNAQPDPTHFSAQLARASVIALGPGLSDANWTDALFAQVCASGKPLVLDADGLTALARHPVPLPQAVLTPHPGEAARLLGLSAAEVEADRYSAARALARRHQAVVVLKGAGSLIDDGQRTVVIADGNPGMASAGMGDVLTGVIAALRAQGLSAWEAAVRGTALHAAAGDRAAGKGERGLAATDLFPELRALLNGGS